MTDLSPDAQAVLNAVVDGAHPAFAPIAAPMAAAALRAAADQVFPLERTPWGSTLTPVLTSRESRSRLLALATELENQ